MSYASRCSCWGVSTVLPTEGRSFISLYSYISFYIHIELTSSTSSNWTVLFLPSIPSFSNGYDPMYLSVSTSNSMSPLSHAVWLFPGTPFESLFNTWPCNALGGTFVMGWCFYLCSFLELCRIPAHLGPRCLLSWIKLNIFCDNELFW